MRQKPVCIDPAWGHGNTPYTSPPKGNNLAPQWPWFSRSFSWKSRIICHDNSPILIQFWSTFLSWFWQFFSRHEIAIMRVLLCNWATDWSTPAPFLFPKIPFSLTSYFHFFCFQNSKILYRKIMPETESCFGPKCDSHFGPKCDSCFGSKHESCFGPKHGSRSGSKCESRFERKRDRGGDLEVDLVICGFSVPDFEKYK